MSGDQQTVLREAAGRTLDAILTGMVGELAAAEEFCAAGGGIVLAGDDDLAALGTAAQPVLDELMRDNETATLIDRIGEIKANTPTPPTVAACERPASEVAAPTTSGNATSKSGPDDPERHLHENDHPRRGRTSSTRRLLCTKVRGNQYLSPTWFMSSPKVSSWPTVPTPLLSALRRRRARDARARIRRPHGSGFLDQRSATWSGSVPR